MRVDLKVSLDVPDDVPVDDVAGKVVEHLDGAKGDGYRMENVKVEVSRREAAARRDDNGLWPGA